MVVFFDLQSARKPLQKPSTETFATLFFKVTLDGHILVYVQN